MERLTHRAGTPPWVRREHEARYAFCAAYVHGKTVLDCACGEGFGAERAAREGAAAIIAFDKDVDAVRAARRRLSRAAHTHVGLADACRLPLPDGIADVYLALETIEHLADDQAFLREAVRVLKPGGLFICSTPNRMLTNPASSLTDRPWNPAHVREYDRREWLRLLGGSFHQIALYGQNPMRRPMAEAWTRVGHAVSTRMAVVLRQALKAPRWILDRDVDHAVQPAQDDLEYEYLVAVCR